MRPPCNPFRYVSRLWRLGLALMMLSGLALAASPRLSTSDPATVTWQGDIEPLFDRECVKCHGPIKQKGGLDLSRFQSAVTGGQSGPAIVPGSPEASLVYRYLKKDSDPHMPPKKQLETREMATIARWIAHLSLGDPEGEPEPSPPSHPSSGTPREPLPDTVSGRPVHQVIDYLIREEWNQRKLVPTSLSDDRTFVRRVYLDLNGRPPSVEEANHFLYSGDSAKRSRLIQRLTRSPDYARHMAGIFDLLLLGRKGTTEQDQRHQHGWMSFLNRAFAKNRPWNEVIYEIILARQPRDHPSDPTAGALWFLYEHKNNHQSIAESIAPMVFGTQIKCAQCHDHPLAHEIKQSHYWGLVAAFNRSKNVTTKAGLGVAESAIGGFVNFANLQQESQPARLVFLNGKSIKEKRPQPGEEEQDSPEAYHVVPPEKDQEPSLAAIPRFSRREGFAQAVTRDNPLLAKAFVNHVWALLLGRGLVHPVDEINSKHPASHPELLDWLANAFVDSQYDMRALIEAIAQCQAYQLTAAPDATHIEHPDAFAYALEKPLTAETLMRLLITATGHSPEEYRRHFPEKAKGLRASITTQFPDLLPVTYQATLQQAMFLTNSPEIDHLLTPRVGNVIDRLLQIKDRDQRIRETFLALLGRHPDATELDYIRAFLKDRKDHPLRGQKQFMWSLLATPEFQLNR